MKTNPEDDGITHINVYSKGKTELGRFLTNFAYSPITTEDGNFNSVEGYWYWLSCKDNTLRKLSGWEAKAAGRLLGSPDWQDSDEFKRKIKVAIKNKIETTPNMFKLLQENKLPLDHYYVYGSKVVRPKEGKWILEYLESFKKK